MSGVNKVILIGNLGRDPELRYTQGGTPVASLNVATTRKWRNKQSNELVEETEWHRISVFGQSAEHCNNYLSKGRQVYVEGRLRTRSYDDKDGIKRYSTEVIADVVQFLGGREGGGGGRGGGDYEGGGGGYGGGGGGRRGGGGGSNQGGGGYGGGGGGGAPDAYDPGDYSAPGPEDDDIPF